MPKHRSHSIEFKRQVAQEFVAGETLYALSKRHDLSRQLIRVWVQKYEAGALDEDAQAAGLRADFLSTLRSLSSKLDRITLSLRLHALIDRLTVLVRKVGAPNAYVDNGDTQGGCALIKLFAHLCC